MAWVSPTGHNDPDEAWGNIVNYEEEKTYDGDTSTFTMSDSVPVGTWTSFLELTHDPLSCDKVRYYQGLSLSYCLAIDIDVFYDGDWHHVYEGSALKNEWDEKTIPEGTKSVTKAQWRVKRGLSEGGTNLKEFEFNEVEAPPPTRRIFITHQ